MHLFHKWQTIVSKGRTATIRGREPFFIGEHKVDCLGVIQRCTKCGKERAWIEYPSGEESISPDLLRYKLSK